MPATTTPDQFGDPTLTAAEAASACGPAAAVAFARANGRNPTLREAVDLARAVGWTEDGGMNGVANQARLLERMGIAAELDTGATPATIGERARAGEMVTVSTPRHYYVVDAYDPTTGRVHVGQSGLARRGGSAWMTLEDIADRDGGINGALYQTVSDTGRKQQRGDGEMDRPPSSFEPPSRFAGVPPGTAGTGPITRSDRMRERIAALQRQRAATQAAIDALLKPGPDETPSDPGERLSPVFQAQAEAARKNRELELSSRRQELSGIDTALRQTEIDLANDPDPKSATDDPVKAERDRIALERDQLALAEARKKAAAATSPEAQKLAELEVKQAEADLERTLNPRAAPRAPRYPDEIAQSEAAAAASRASAARTTALLPGEIAKSDLELAEARKKLLPQQQQIYQAHQDTVKYIQGMWERGEIEPGQAEAYVKLSRDAAEAGLRGTTPFNEMKERREAEQQRQRMGVDLLNQRLSSGAGMANSLMSSALGSNMMLRPGQTSLNADPLAGLLPLLAQLQGGEDVTPFARGMLMGGQGGLRPLGSPGVNASPFPTGPLPAGL